MVADKKLYKVKCQNCESEFVTPCRRTEQERGAADTGGHARYCPCCKSTALVVTEIPAEKSALIAKSW
jgi:hypothetical protein